MELALGLVGDEADQDRACEGREENDGQDDVVQLVHKVPWWFKEAATTQTLMDE